MTQELKRELSLSIQYFLMTLVAHVVAFFGMLPPLGSGEGELADAINLSEAWRNVDPYIKSTLLIFTVLSIVRFLFIFLVRPSKRPLH